MNKARLARLEAIHDELRCLAFTEREEEYMDEAGGTDWPTVAVRDGLPAAADSVEQVVKYAKEMLGVQD